MTTTKIINITIQNFKGIARYSHDFTEGKNVISAENGAGKSWLYLAIPLKF